MKRYRSVPHEKQVVFSSLVNREDINFITSHSRINSMIQGSYYMYPSTNLAPKSSYYLAS